MTRHIALLAASALLAAAGCSIPYSASDERQTNLCSGDSDCADGAFCTHVDGVGTCLASSVDLADLVIEVRPAVGTTFAASSSLISLGSLAADATGSGVHLIDVDLPLPSFVDVSPQVLLMCAGTLTPVPAKIHFQPVPELFGLLEGQTYQADSVLDAAGNESLKASIPPGVYDVYLQPKPDLALTPDCTVAPPIFLPRQSLQNNVKFNVQAGAPLRLTGTLKLSEKEDFTKWYLEVVEPYGGQTISEVVQPTQVGIALEVPFEVWFDWTDRTAYIPIVRLRPPEGSGKPVIHWQLDALAAVQGVVGDKVPVELDVSNIDTRPRKVGGQVLHDTETAAATVTLRSTSLSGDELTRYEAVVETNEAGLFETQLPPGEYQVIARPHDERLAVGDTTWTIKQADDCFCGNSVKVPSATTLAGTVSTPAGDPVTVDVRLTPAATGPLAYLGTMFTPEIQARPANVFSAGGEFQLSVDPGLYDLSFVADEGSGYPWLVRPRLLVSGSNIASPPVVSLAPFQLQNPIVLQGFVVDPTGAALPGATVRAWLPVGATSGSKLPPSAVQIGATVADETGAYVLRLPPSIREGQ